MVGSLQFPVNWPCQDAGQFFHLQCIQLALPSIPGQPLLYASLKSWSCPRHWMLVDTVVRITHHNFSENFCALDDCIFCNSKSIIHKSTGEPYASIRSATVTFWKGEKPRRPAAFLCCWKKARLACMSSTISMELSFGHADASPEHVQREGTTWHELVEHEPLVPNVSVLTKFRTTNLRSWVLPLPSG